MICNVDVECTVWNVVCCEIVVQYVMWVCLDVECGCDAEWCAEMWRCDLM